MKTQIKLLVLFCLLSMGATAFISFNLNGVYSDYKGKTST